MIMADTAAWRYSAQIPSTTHPQLCATGFDYPAGGFPQVWLLFAWGGREGTHTIGYINPGLLGSSSRPSLY